MIRETEQTAAVCIANQVELSTPPTVVRTYGMSDKARSLVMDELSVILNVPKIETLLIWNSCKNIGGLNFLKRFYDTLDKNVRKSLVDTGLALVETEDLSVQGRELDIARFRALGAITIGSILIYDAGIFDIPKCLRYEIFPSENYLDGSDWNLQINVQQ